MDLNHVSLDQLKTVISYDPSTGVFTWIVSNRPGWDGKEAGWLLNNGYIAIEVFGQTVLAHRLAWFYSHGIWPVGEIDHRDRDRTNNRISNLRDVSKSTNQANVGLRTDNTSGVRGINWNKRLSRWAVRLQVNNKRYFLGYFDSFDDAVEARQLAFETHHKDEYDAEVSHTLQAR
jgi:hypothetical protein